MVRQRGQSWQATPIHCSKQYRPTLTSRQEAIRWEAEARGSRQVS
jgi:hypothetical protein